MTDSPSELTLSGNAAISGGGAEEMTSLSQGLLLAVSNI